MHVVQRFIENSQTIQFAPIVEHGLQYYKSLSLDHLGSHFINSVVQFLSINSYLC